MMRRDLNIGGDARRRSAPALASSVLQAAYLELELSDLSPERINAFARS
jgi:hypothetical protein